MGGTIGVTSAPGFGSEFSVILPLLLDGEEAQQLSSSMDLAQDGPRMLIADDHPLALNMLTKVASSIGWRVMESSSGEDAVITAIAEASGGRPFDVLLLDWKMPGRTASAAVQLRTALDQHPSPAIILVTPHDKVDLAQGTLAGVVDAVLSKPVTASAMRNAVERARRNLIGQREQNIHRGHEMRLAGLSILVVDDSDINREVAHQILENEGARVLLAENGSQAMATLKAKPRDVQIVLMDVQMPVMDGYEATRHIRETLCLADLPVVALSAGVLKDQQAATLKAGMSGFIAKPFDVDHLVGTILRLTGRQKTALPPATIRDEEAVLTIDVARGLRSWNDSAAYSNYLRRFVATHGNDGAAIARLLTEGMRREACANLHKLKGAAGSMALMAVLRNVEGLEQALDRGHDTRVPVRRLQDALNAARVAIAAYAGVRQEAPRQAVSSDEATMIHLLDKLLLALDLDNPEKAETIIEALTGHLPSDRIAALRECLVDFDFRGAEGIARALFAPQRSLQREMVSS